MTDINKDFYCSAGAYSVPHDDCNISGDCIKEKCLNYHRKHPTPEQFEQEYGFKYPDDGAVYLKYHLPPRSQRNKELPHRWHINTLAYAKKNLINDVYDGAKKTGKTYPIGDFVCACTPWGKPPDDWRPE